MPAKVYLSFLLVAAFMFTCSLQQSDTASCFEQLEKCERKKIPYGEYVCGSDYETYDNLCELIQANCSNLVNLHVQYNGKCMFANKISQEQLLDSMKPEIIRPPCMTDLQKLLTNDLMYGKYGSNAAFLPSCRSDGNYDSVQCESVSQECWCSDKQGYKIETLGITANKSLVCPRKGNSSTQTSVHGHEVVKTENNSSFSDLPLNTEEEIENTSENPCR